MIKQLTLTFDCDNPNTQSKDNVASDAFGISKDRADFLLTYQSTAAKAAMACGSKDVNKVDQFANFISRENLSGDDVAFLCYCGFTAMANVNQAVARLARDPLAIISLLGQLD